MPDWDALLTAAQRVAVRHFATGVRFRVERVLQSTVYGVVARVGVRGGAGVPDTLIVKAAGPPPGAAEMLFNDWAATELLTRIGGDPPLCARFYGGDPRTPLILLEDLGRGAGSPYLLVNDADPEAATASLIGYISAIAALHRQALGHASRFATSRRIIEAPKPLYHDPWSDAREHTDVEIDTAVAEYRRVLESIGVTIHPGVDDEIAEVTHRVEYPGPFTTLCQGDQNGLRHCMLSSGRLRLFDFGVAGYRHALLEGLPHRITWGCIRRVPPSVATAMELTYKNAIAGALPVSGFDQAVTDAMARWHIFHVLHRIPDALQGDRPRGPATLRQQTIAWIDAFAHRHTEHSARPALGANAHRLAVRLRELWPVRTHAIPYFRAFRGS